ncbi:YxeA family protein [Enterococcus faecalis]|uniref:YxeA family protein n=1 Tax=Enterococcus faecalis TaxID=1351 RepID=UPI003D0B4928
MKLLKKILISVLLVIGLFIVLATINKNQIGEFAGIIDRFNPLVPEKELYVKSRTPDTVNSHGIATYIQEAADKNGNKRTIQFNAIQTMTEGIYVKLHTKGAYVEEIEKCEESQVPKKALKELNDLSPN